MSITHINLQSYLSLAKTIKNLPTQDFWTAYDAEADVLYINFHQPALSADDSELLVLNKVIFGVIRFFLWLSRSFGYKKSLYKKTS